MGAIAFDDGASPWVPGNPYAYARAKGITIRQLEGAPFEVGSDDRIVVVRPHVDERVTRSRVCEGIAQCLLTRAGVEWSAAEAAQLGRQLERRLDAGPK